MIILQGAIAGKRPFVVSGNMDEGGLRPVSAFDTGGGPEALVSGAPQAGQLSVFPQTVERMQMFDHARLE